MFSFRNPPSTIEFDRLKWCRYNNEDIISEKRFKLVTWNRILSGINTTGEFIEYLDKYKGICCAYTLYLKWNDTPVAVIILMDESGWVDNCEHGKMISIHGGGWSNDAGYRYFFAKSWILLLDYFNRLGCRIFTSFHDLNKKASGLILNTGFEFNATFNMYEYHPESNRYGCLVEKSQIIKI